MIHAAVDYATAYFQYPSLDKIPGEPSYTSLKDLKRQIKANAISVVSDLGGGQFGHLGLVLSPEDYALISDIPYVRPEHPGVLDIPVGTAHHEAVRLRDEYHENNRLFRETLQVERAIIKQIVAAVDSEYLKELRDDATHTITMSVPEVLNHLFLHYGQVDSEVLDKEEESLKNFVWNLNDPPIKFFNMIEDLVTLAQAANLEKSQHQIVGFGLNIVRRTGDMESNIKEWNARPANQKSWINFKTHFNAAHRELKLIRGPTMRNTAFHQAHQVANDLSRDFNHMRDDVMAVMHSISMMKEATDTGEETEPAPPAIEKPSPSMNSTIVDKELLAALLQLKEEVKQLKSNQNNRRFQGGNSNRNGNNNRRPRRNVSKYCWTHGACSHNSKDCENKNSGHKDEATFNTKLGGSTEYCD